MTDARAVKSLRVARILWGALLGSMAIYVVIANVIVHDQAHGATVPMPELASAPAQQPLVLVLAVVSLVELVVGLFLRGRMMPPRRKTSDSPRGDVHKALQRLRVAEIIGWAFCEAIAINGLLLTMLSYEPAFSFVFTGVGALAMLALAPSQRIVDDVVHAAAD
jgi:hypothetical protein